MDNIYLAKAFVNYILDFIEDLWVLFNELDIHQQSSIIVAKSCYVKPDVINDKTEVYFYKEYAVAIRATR
ncbi:hypothetical protein Dform_00352 [Dehalogenimonas formicexedens]|uniref:Uncharacterized protein n=1 Tax=Dehalogenimonas formicexedens TaxID=1839801 RepID=A0A1P8F5T6_9CHLR|nr:hypothetical protein Dform_00352 [Dehalogenimonas formicexedens]